MKEETQQVNLTTINLDSLAILKKNDYLKLLKKPSSLKKKEAFIFICKYECVNGKLPIVAVPYKKMSEAKKDFKDRVKKDKKAFGGSKFILLAETNIVKEEDGNLIFEARPLAGGADIEVAAAKLFSKMKMGFRLIGEATPEQLEAQKELEKDLSPQELEQLAKKKAKRLARYAKISENLSKLELALSKFQEETKKESLAANIQKMEEALGVMVDEALSDGVIDAEEQQQIDALEAQLLKLNTSSTSTTLSKEEINLRMAKIDENIARLKAALKIS